MENACQFAEGQARAKAPRRTGWLAGHVAHLVTAHGLEVIGYVYVREKGKGGVFYAYFQEMGTHRMAAHPFLRPAVFGNAAEIVRLIASG